MKCTICEVIRGKPKHIMLKKDNLEKHMNKWKTKHDIPDKRLKKDKIHYNMVVILPYPILASFC